MSTPAENFNIARHLALMAAAHPTRAALKIPRGRTRAPLAQQRIDYLMLTFAELDAEVSAWCARLSSAGIARGDRTLLMVRQGLPLIASAFALFRLGAVPVVIDPGMGRKISSPASPARAPRPSSASHSRNCSATSSARLSAPSKRGSPPAAP